MIIRKFNLTFLFLGAILVIGGLFSSAYTSHHAQNPADRNAYYEHQSSSGSSDVFTKAVDILFSNGLSGVMIALLTYILFVSNKQAQKERSEHMDSVRELWKDNMKSTGDLALEVKEMHGDFKSMLSDHSARLQNIEREIEMGRDSRRR